MTLRGSSTQSRLYGTSDCTNAAQNGAVSCEPRASGSGVPAPPGAERVVVINSRGAAHGLADALRIGLRARLLQLMGVDDPDRSDSEPSSS